MEIYYKAYLNVLQMLEDRLYITKQKKKELELTPLDFVTKKNRNIAELDIKNIKTRDGMPAMVVFFDEDLKDYKQTALLEQIKKRLNDDIINTTYLIIVYNTDVDNAINFEDIIKKEKTFLANNKKIQLFPITSISYNIMRTSFMPSISIVTDPDDREQLLNMGKQALNVIFISDPISRYLGLATGDIIKCISRGLDTNSISWRRVQ